MWQRNNSEDHVQTSVNKLLLLLLLLLYNPEFDDRDTFLNEIRMFRSLQIYYVFMQY